MIRRSMLIFAATALAHGASMMDAGSGAAVSPGGCASAPARSRAQGGGDSIDLTVGLLPILNIDPKYSFLAAKVAGEIDGMGLFKSVRPIDPGDVGNVDLVATLDGCPAPCRTNELPTVTVTSGQTGKKLYAHHFDYGFCGFVYYCIVPSKIGQNLAEAFAAGGPLYKRVRDEKRQSGGLGERKQSKPPADIEDRITQAEQAGDAALTAGDSQKAFASFAEALSGAWYDGEASGRVREKLMKLLASYHRIPDVSEEARRHMVRAKAAIKDSQDFGSYDQAGTEMMQALSAAPWWSSAYYNLALIQEKQGYVDDAMRNMRLYLLANPQAPDARAVQDKIYALEMRLERKSHQ